MDYSILSHPPENLTRSAHPSNNHDRFRTPSIIAFNHRLVFLAMWLLAIRGLNA